MSADSREIPPPPPGADHARSAPGTLDRSLALVRFLRENCPWDASQTAETLLPHLVEEAHEVAQAIRDEDPAELEAELGDLLLNVAFQVVVAEEGNQFTADSVVRGLEEKMARRHPHLYGRGPRESWKVIKARELAERARSESDGTAETDTGVRDQSPSTLDGIPSTVDPLTRANRLQSRAAGAGFDWESPHGALEKVTEELGEVREALEEGHRDQVDEELGDLLFAVVNVVRLAGAHPSTALERANRKFERRFRAVEAVARRRGISLEEASLETLDAIWDEVKQAEKSGGD